MDLFISYQYVDDMNEDFANAALLEALRFVPVDFFTLEDYRPVYEDARAYLML